MKSSTPWGYCTRTRISGGVWGWRCPRSTARRGAEHRGLAPTRTGRDHINNRPWSEPELLLLETGVREGLTNQEILNRLEGEGYSDRTGNAVSQKCHALGLPNETERRVRVVRDSENVRILTADTNREEPIDDLLERTLERTSQAVEQALTQSYATARIVTSKPIALTFVSDQHISTDGPVDMERMFADAELIQQTPGVYCLLGGDGVDNHLKHRRAIVNSGSKPSDEWRLYNQYLGVLGHKALAMISGNHDDWSIEMAGIDMVFWLAQKQKIHYAPDQVVLTVELVPGPDVDGQPYVIKMRHKYRYGSSFNQAHTVHRLYDWGGDAFDIGVIAHHHEACFATFNKHGLTRYAFRPGSYQVTSSYARGMGFNNAYPSCPTAVLFPDERRIVPFEDLRVAIDYLRAVRESAAA